MTRECAFQATKAALFSVAASSATAAILLMISLCFPLPVPAAPADHADATPGTEFQIERELPRSA